MPSPFPGMDPYLEGYLWPDVHNALANKIRQLLAPRLRPRYIVRLEIYVVEDTAPETEIGTSTIASPASIATFTGPTTCRAISPCAVVARTT